MAEVEEAQANLKSIRAQYLAAMTKRDRYKTAAAAGVISLNQLEEAQLEVEQQQQAMKAAIASLKRVKAALNPSNSEVAIATERLAQEEAAGKVTLASLNQEREALLQQRIEITKNLERDSRELQQVEIDLSQTLITATAEGIISKLSLRNPGQTVRSGEEIAQIFPLDAPLEVKALVSPSDIGKLEPGQEVQMRVSACPYRDYGTLKGAIGQISQDTIKTQSNNAISSQNASSNKTNGATGFYEVTIEPENLSLGRGKKQCSIQLGMEGRADIISREETLLKFLLRKARLIADL